jgi:hypothetical protein
MPQATAREDFMQYLRPEANVTFPKADEAEKVLVEVMQWAEARSFSGLALVGSYARGQARERSDIDLVLLANDPDVFRQDAAWLTEIAWSRAGVHPLAHEDAQYGAVWSRHVQLDNGLEIEFSFAPLSWADTTPIDPGTRRVVMDGCRILYDPGCVLAALCAAVELTA